VVGTSAGNASVVRVAAAISDLRIRISACEFRVRSELQLEQQRVGAGIHKRLVPDASQTIQSIKQRLTFNGDEGSVPAQL
jgi:hypothetical protein